MTHQPFLMSTATPRRNFLKRSGLGLGGAWLAAIHAGCRIDPGSPDGARTDELPIALQLYSVREQAFGDFPGTLEAIAGMGYQGVEFAGFHGHDPKDLGKLLADLGLRSVGSHVRLAALSDQEIEGTVEAHRAVGSASLVVPFHAETRPDTLDGWRTVADGFNRIAERLRSYGMRLGYHNYDKEFAPVEGRIPWLVFAEATGPDITLQLDTAAATRGGGDVLALFGAHPGRFHTVHLEDHAPDGSVVLPGDGMVPFAEVISFCRERGGTEWLIIEQESHPESMSPMASVRECLRRIRGFAD